MKAEPIKLDNFWEVRTAVIDALRKHGMEDATINAALRGDLLPLIAELAVEARIQELDGVFTSIGINVETFDRKDWQRARDYMNARVKELELMLNRGKG